MGKSQASFSATFVGPRWENLEAAIMAQLQIWDLWPHPRRMRQRLDEAPSALAVQKEGTPKADDISESCLISAWRKDKHVFMVRGLARSYQDFMPFLQFLALTLEQDSDIRIHPLARKF